MLDLYHEGRQSLQVLRLWLSLENFGYQLNLPIAGKVLLPQDLTCTQMDMIHILPHHSTLGFDTKHHRGGLSLFDVENIDTKCSEMLRW